MARNPTNTVLDTQTKRAELAPRAEPYWHRDSPGIFLGYRKTTRGSRAWVAKRRNGKDYVEFHLGTPNDGPLKANGDDVLDYVQALHRLRTAPLPLRDVDGHQPKPKFKRHPGDGLTLNQCVEMFLDYRQEHPGGPRNQVMTDKARKIAASLWNVHAGDIGRQSAAATTAQQLKAWMFKVSKSYPQRRGHRPFDPADPDHLRSRQSTANRLLTTVKAALNWAWREGMLPDNSKDWWRAVQKFKLGQGRPPRMLSNDEIPQLVNACTSAPLRNLVLAALHCGARAGELRRLRVQDYSREFGTVRIYQSKTHKTLVQPLTSHGRRFFEELAGRRPAADFLLLDEADKAWTAHSYKREFNAARDAAGFGPDVKFKTMRATYGKLLLLATGNLEIVAKALGHSDTKTTREHYAQYLPNEVADGIAKMAPLGV